MLGVEDRKSNSRWMHDAEGGRWQRHWRTNVAATLAYECSDGTDGRRRWWNWRTLVVTTMAGGDGDSRRMESVKGGSCGWSFKRKTRENGHRCLGKGAVETRSFFCFRYTFMSKFLRGVQKIKRLTNNLYLFPFPIKRQTNSLLALKDKNLKPLTSFHGIQIRERRKL